MIYNNPHKYLVNADFTINITAENLKQLLAQVLSEQFNCVISSKDIEFDLETITQGYGMHEYQETKLKGCKVNVRATDQAAAASSVTYRGPSMVLDGVIRDYNDCIYGTVETTSTPTVIAKKVDDCNVIG